MSVDNVWMSGEWEKIEVTADSGAADMVGPPIVAEAFKVNQTDASRNGKYYLAANGERIYNEGEKKLQGYPQEGTPLKMTMQVAMFTMFLHR